MLGAIIGDIVGSAYEWNRIKSVDFPFFQPLCSFTDDTVMTIATANSILHNVPYAQAYKKLGLKYPNAGYGINFRLWILSDNSEPYNSWGNGSAMRVSPVGFSFDSEQEVLDEAKKSAEVTHNHPEGIKGAQATALAIYLARTGHDKEKIRKEIDEKFNYDLSRTVGQIRSDYDFDVSCQGSVPEAIIAFLDSNDFESAVRLAVSLGGDSDTQACIAGAIAEAYYKDIPSWIVESGNSYLPLEFKETIESFRHQFF